MITTGLRKKNCFAFIYETTAPSEAVGDFRNTKDNKTSTYCHRLKTVHSKASNLQSCNKVSKKISAKIFERPKYNTITKQHGKQMKYITVSFH